MPMDDRYEDNPMLIKRKPKGSGVVGITREEAESLFTPHVPSFDSPFYLRFRDLNNSPDSPYENRPHPAVEIGLKITF